MKRTRPRTSTNSKTRRSTELRAEKRLCDRAAAALNKDAPGADKLLALALQTRTGRRRFTNLAKLILPTEEQETLFRNVSTLVKSTGRHHKVEVIHLLAEGLPSSFAKRALKIKQATLKQARETRHQPMATPEGKPTYSMKMAYTPNTDRDKIGHYEGIVLNVLFHATTVVFSGANTTTRVLETKIYEWEAEVYALYPDALRTLAKEFPHLLNPRPEKDDWVPKTRFERCIVAAVIQAKTRTFNQLKEIADRREYAKRLYFTKLAKKKGFTLEG